MQVRQVVAWASGRWIRRDGARRRFGFGQTILVLEGRPEPRPEASSHASFRAAPSTDLRISVQLSPTIGGKKGGWRRRSRRKTKKEKHKKSKTKKKKKVPGGNFPLYKGGNPGIDGRR